MPSWQALQAAVAHTSRSQASCDAHPQRSRADFLSRVCFTRLNSSCMFIARTHTMSAQTSRNSSYRGANSSVGRRQLQLDKSDALHIRSSNYFVVPEDRNIRNVWVENLSDLSAHGG